MDASLFDTSEVCSACNDAAAADAEAELDFFNITVVGKSLVEVTQCYSCRGRLVAFRLHSGISEANFSHWVPFEMMLELVKQGWSYEQRKRGSQRLDPYKSGNARVFYISNQSASPHYLQVLLQAHLFEKAQAEVHHFQPSQYYRTLLFFRHKPEVLRQILPRQTHSYYTLLRKGKGFRSGLDEEGKGKGSSRGLDVGDLQDEGGVGGCIKVTRRKHVTFMHSQFRSLLPGAEMVHMRTPAEVRPGRGKGSSRGRAQSPVRIPGSDSQSEESQPSREGEVELAASASDADSDCVSAAPQLAPLTISRSRKGKAAAARLAGSATPGPVTVPGRLERPFATATSLWEASTHWAGAIPIVQRLDTPVRTSKTRVSEPMDERMTNAILMVIGNSILVYLYVFYLLYYIYKFTKYKIT